MSELVPPSEDDGVEAINLREALEERYLAYALSTIMHRALPDVRDGLKPVHRRLLYAMQLLKLDPSSGFKKCARVVGDVIGKYHPHGDQSVYDALVRLAQSFAQRYPLIDGQGNFGNIDGDNAAAMRYTESRLTRVAQLLLEGINEDAVEFRDTYDEEDEEPIVLPGNFPNLLANGAQGIAVGMATSIPPHNAAELCSAALHLIKFPNAGAQKLCEFVPGPDLPTGGIIVDEPENIIEAYKTGRGGFRVRARWEREDTGRGSYEIIVTEIPYMVQKSKLVEKIAELMTAKKLPLLSDIRDESAEDIRLVLVPKSRAVDPLVLMESLFLVTDLESRISLNMNVLNAKGAPEVMGLREVLNSWLAHKRDVLLRRTDFRLGKIEKRLEVLGGYLIAYLNLDEVIRIIREEDDAKKELMRSFKLTDGQAEAILNMRLRALRKLEEIEIKTEHDALIKEQKDLNKLKGDEKSQWDKIATDIREIRDEFSLKTDLGARRTELSQQPEVEVDLKAAMIEREPITIVVSEKGWMRSMKGHGLDTSSLSYKDGDKGKFTFEAETTDKIMVFATSGKFYTLAADGLPGGRGHGEPVRLMVDMDGTDDIVALFVHKPGRKLLVASTEANGFIVAEDDVLATTKKGKQVLNVKTPTEACVCTPISDGADHLAVIGENRKLIIFPLSELPEMGRGRGVRLQKYKDGGLSDAQCFKLADGLTWIDSSGRSWNVEDLDDWMGARAQAGRLPMKGFPRNNKFGLAI